MRREATTLSPMAGGGTRTRDLLITKQSRTPWTAGAFSQNGRGRVKGLRASPRPAHNQKGAPKRRYSLGLALADVRRALTTRARASIRYGRHDSIEFRLEAVKRLLVAAERQLRLAVRDALVVSPKRRAA